MKNNYIEFLNSASKKAKANILTMTTVAASGHPGGAISSLDLFLTTLLFSNIFENSNKIQNGKADLSVENKDYFKLNHNKDNDAFYISHGHTAPGWYAALEVFGMIELEECLAGYRKLNSPFSGHVENSLPFISWDTGSLGQGLSAACAKALYVRDLGYEAQIYVFMGDGEQQKGQISEARRFIKKFNLTNIHIFIDYNKLQVNGNINEVMPQNIKEEWEAAGFRVLETDGHDFNQIYDCLITDFSDKQNSYMILANTVSGKNVSFMENINKYVASAVSYSDCKIALQELGAEEKIDYYKQLRNQIDFTQVSQKFHKKSFEKEWSNLTNSIKGKSESYYEVDAMIDCKSAYGDTLIEISNELLEIPVYTFDCDLAIAVKTDGFMRKHADRFFQSGIQEHHTVSCAGSLSKEKALVFYSDFGVFGLYEPFNQHNLNSLNDANLKTVVTHCGMVGEDGKTHHCCNYVGVASSLFNTKLIVPADANQTKDVIRYISKNYGNYFVTLGRSSSPIICNEEGMPYFNKDYIFEYGKADIIKESKCNYIISMGSIFGNAYKTCIQLSQEGIDIGLINITTPLDIDERLAIILSGTNVFVFEDHNVNCGLYKEMSAFLWRHKVFCQTYNVGLTTYAESGEYNELLEINHLNNDSMKVFIKEQLA